MHFGAKRIDRIDDKIIWSPRLIAHRSPRHGQVLPHLYLYREGLMSLIRWPQRTPCSAHRAARRAMSWRLILVRLTVSLSTIVIHPLQSEPRGSAAQPPTPPKPSEEPLALSLCKAVSPKSKSVRLCQSLSMSYNQMIDGKIKYKSRTP